MPGECHTAFIPLILIDAYSCFAMRMIYAVEFVVALHLTNNLDDLVEVDERRIVKQRREYT